MICDPNMNELMTKYLDGNLDSFEETNLINHIEICPNCAEEFAVYQEMLDSFSSLPMVEAPEGFGEAIMARIEKENIKPKVAFSWSDKIMMVSAGLGLGLAALLIVLNYNDISLFSGNIATFFENPMNWVSSYVTPFAWIFIAVFGVIASVLIGLNFKTYLSAKKVQQKFRVEHVTTE